MKPIEPELGQLCSARPILTQQEVEDWYNQYMGLAGSSAWPHAIPYTTYGDQLDMLLQFLEERGLVEPPAPPPCNQYFVKDLYRDKTKVAEVCCAVCNRVETIELPKNHAVPTSELAAKLLVFSAVCTALGCNTTQYPAPEWAATETTFQLATEP